MIILDTQVLVDEAIEALQSKIDDTAIIACSGGIDSSVAAVLAHRAVGKSTALRIRRHWIHEKG